VLPLRPQEAKDRMQIIFTNQVRGVSTMVPSINHVRKSVVFGCLKYLVQNHTEYTNVQIDDSFETNQ
jgi:hypothetical protein